MVFGIDTSEIDEEESSVEEIEGMLNEFEEKGYHFFPSWTMDSPVVPDRIRMPSGIILDEFELDKWFNGKRLITGNKEQLEVLGAQEFYSLVRCLDCHERYSRYDTSFINDDDICRCERKYSIAA